MVTKFFNVNIFTKEGENSELLDEVTLSEIIQKAKLQYPVIKFIHQSIFEKNNVLKTIDSQQIVQNLIENSVKYGASEVVLDFKFREEIKLIFSDDGIGIPTNDFPFIFDKYYRADRLSTKM